jgi:hypothetical protein
MSESEVMNKFDETRPRLAMICNLLGVPPFDGHALASRICETLRQQDINIRYVPLRQEGGKYGMRWLAQADYVIIFAAPDRIGVVGDVAQENYFCARENYANE